jgi:hypothetical protein
MLCFVPVIRKVPHLILWLFEWVSFHYLPTWVSEFSELLLDRIMPYFSLYLLAQQNVCPQLGHRTHFWTYLISWILNMDKLLWLFHPKLWVSIWKMPPRCQTPLPFQPDSPQYILDLPLPRSQDMDCGTNSFACQAHLSALCRVAPFIWRLFGTLSKDYVNRRPMGLKWSDRFLPQIGVHTCILNFFIHLWVPV